MNKEKKLKLLWDKVLLKKCYADNFNNTITICDNSKNSKYQIFEVLVTETLARLYSDFDWRTSPVQNDEGIDFTAEKKINKTSDTNYFPQLIIYGQVKRRSSGIYEKLLLDATSNIIRFYRKNDIQDKCLYEIIHVFSSEKKIMNEIKKTIENIDYLHYCVRIINAEYLFRIWCLNKKFIYSIVDKALSQEELLVLDDYIKDKETSWESLFTFKKTVKKNISVGQTFESIIEIDSLLGVEFSLKVKWLPAGDSKILLVSPQLLLDSSLLSVKSINNKIIFDVQFLAGSTNKHNLGILQFISPFNQVIYNMPLGEIDVKKEFNPLFSETPVYYVTKELRNLLKEKNNKPRFYALIGEGGIGKSKLLENIRIFAINNRYRSINIEHSCNWEDDRTVLFQLISFLCKCKNYENTDLLYIYLRQTFGGLYKTEWDDDLLNFLNGRLVENFDNLIECLFHLLLYVLESDSLYITLSNMHWASPSLLATIKLLIETVNDNRLYLKNKIAIIFEGRSEEKTQADYRNLIPYDWINFYNNNILKKIKLKKWSSEDSKLYIRSMFNQPKTVAEYEELDNLQSLLLKYSSGNPMHINEMLKLLLSSRSLTIDSKGSLCILVAETSVKFSSEILEMILLRIQFYMEKEPYIMDYLIILANLIQEDCALYSKIINDIFEDMNIDGMLFFRETGFVEVKNDILFFTHEHYRTLLMKQKIHNFITVERFLSYAASEKRPLSNISIVNLMLLKNDKSDLYREKIFCKIQTSLNNSDSIFEKYSLLKLFEEIPSHILQNNDYPLYKIYRFLIDYAMVLANYTESKKYIAKMCDLTELMSNDYYRNLIYAKKMLSNINGLQMKMDSAVSEGLDAISTLEKYLNMLDFKSDKLYNELILLYDRVAIEYYMAGQYQECSEYHNKALNMLNKHNDEYVRYHILYEQGVRELHTNPEEGIKNIEDSLKNIPTYDFMTENQEKNLILADLLMGKIICAETDKQVVKIKEEALEKCKELSTSKEPFESIIYHWVTGICLIKEGKYKEAARYFKTSVVISAKTPINSTLWKSYLNLSQAYFLMSGKENDRNAEYYRATALYYVMEAKDIISDALNCNIWTKKDFEKRLSYPLSLINKLIGGSDYIDIQFKDISCLHVDFEGFSFFMLD